MTKGFSFKLVQKIITVRFFLVLNKRDLDFIYYNYNRIQYIYIYIYIFFFHILRKPNSETEWREGRFMAPIPDRSTIWLSNNPLHPKRLLQFFFVTGILLIWLNVANPRPPY
jgi:hypothetical protein